ncbi:MAG: DUF4405 domain-containing protein [Clostridia bacterium]|nr:DUF4405 domain-containing protein [Clostridia bacterium]
MKIGIVKKIIKIAVDVAMFVLFLLLMEYHLLPEATHEWLGIAVFILFIAHNALNYKWYSVLFKGKYTAIRIVQTSLNFLLIIGMLLCMISALFVSREVFAGMNLQAGMVGRTLHMKATAWTFILMSVHLGLHWSMFVGMAKRIKLSVLTATVIKWILRAVVLGIAVYGIVVFVQRGFYEELFVAEVFRGNIDEKTALVAFTFFLQTLAMSVSVVSIAYYVKKLSLYIKKIRKERHNEKIN